MKRLISILFFLLLTSGCAIQYAQIAADAKTSMIGMSKQQVLQCMGVSNNVQSVGDVESWQYFSGGQSFVNTNVNVYNNYATANSSVTTRYCIINITFVDGKVSSVTYSGRTGGLLSAGEQCAYAVSNCVQ